MQLNYTKVGQHFNFQHRTNINKHQLGFSWHISFCLQLRYVWKKTPLTFARLKVKMNLLTNFRLGVVCKQSGFSWKYFSNLLKLLNYNKKVPIFVCLGKSVKIGRNAWPFPDVRPIIAKHNSISWQMWRKIHIQTKCRYLHFELNTRILWCFYFTCTINHMKIVFIISRLYMYITNHCENPLWEIVTWKSTVKVSSLWSARGFVLKHNLH